MNDAPKPVWILPEYCPGPIFGGWHLYVRSRTRERAPVGGRRGWWWLRDELQLCNVHRALAEVGIDLPDPFRSFHGHKFKEAFVQAYPAGILATVEADERTFRVTRPFDPAPKHARSLHLFNARMLVTGVMRMGMAWVEGGRDTPQSEWTAEQWGGVLDDLLEGMRLRDMARALTPARRRWTQPRLLGRGDHGR